MTWTNFKNIKTDLFLNKEHAILQNTVGMNFKTISCAVILGENLV